MPSKKVYLPEDKTKSIMVELYNDTGKEIDNFSLYPYKKIKDVVEEFLYISSERKNKMTRTFDSNHKVVIDRFFSRECSRIQKVTVRSRDIQNIAGNSMILQLTDEPDEENEDINIFLADGFDGEKKEADDHYRHTINQLGHIVHGGMHRLLIKKIKPYSSICISMNLSLVKDIGFDKDGIVSSSILCNLVTESDKVKSNISFANIVCTEDEFRESDLRVRKLIDQFLLEKSKESGHSDLDLSMIKHFKTANEVGIQKNNINKLLNP